MRFKRALLPDASCRFHRVDALDPPGLPRASSAAACSRRGASWASRFNSAAISVKRKPLTSLTLDHFRQLATLAHGLYAREERNETPAREQQQKRGA